MSQADANIAAFLSMIKHAEGTDRKHLVSDPYRCCYAYKQEIDGKDGIAGTLDDWIDHPAITGEWMGEPLKAQMCIDAGIPSGKCRSTAAGAYQMIVRTWKGLKRDLHLPDFSPASQDKAAVELIKREGALDDVRSGRITEAIRKVRKQWASMPGAGVGQPERKMADLLQHYKSMGGVLQ